MSGPLTGVRIIELGAWVAVPGATAVLGDWGADIIKIEDPFMGDPVRGWKSIRGVEVTDVHFWFEGYNRNKKSMGLDLRLEEGRAILYKLIEQADVFISNFQYPVLEKLKIAYDTLSEINPGLIYGVVSGYGTKGPDVEKPGYDITAFWARSGILEKLIPESEAPIMPPVGMGDTIVGTFMAGAVSAALFNREKTGEGQEIDLSLFHAGAWVGTLDIQACLYTEKPIGQMSRLEVPNPIDNEYLTKDNKWVRIVCLQSDRLWPDFCAAVGIEHLKNDDRFRDAEARHTNNTDLITIISDIFIKKTAEEWETIFMVKGLAFATYQGFQDVINDAQAIENGFFSEVEHPSSGKIKVMSTPFKFSRTPAEVRTSAPELGQHTEEILLELGYSWEDIIECKDKKVIQ